MTGPGGQKSNRRQTLLPAAPRVELAAVNQCSGNSRGFTDPRVPGAQWANGAMGNAKWMGVRLKDVLDRAGVKAGATMEALLEAALARGMRALAAVVHA